MIKGFFDGASRGNPGLAGAGILIYDGEKVIWRLAKPLGVRTNNEAEYLALGLLVNELSRRRIKDVEICGDSKLIISQVSGLWKIKEPRLAALASPIIAKLREINASFVWVPREKNSEADKLSNLALDKGYFEEDSGKSTTSTAGLEQEPPSINADKDTDATPISAKKVSSHIWVIREGNEEFAVDLTHDRCTCKKGENCRHIVALKRMQYKP